MSRTWLVAVLALGLSVPAAAEYLGSWRIDDYVGIPATTHRFSTGAAYAPSALTYSIYEDGSTTGIDEDVAITVGSPFDAITGCYYVRRQLTTAAGFEKGKNYVVVVKATVDSIAGVAVHTFQIQAEVDARSVSATNVSANVAQWKGSTAPDMTGDAFGRLGAPAGASVSADIATVKGYVDTEVAAIKAKTDNLPASPAAVGSQMDFVNAPNATAVTAIQSGLATASSLSTVAGYVDTEVAVIKAVTDKLDTAMELDGADYRFTANAVEQVSLGDDAMTEEEFNALLLAYWNPASDPVILTPDYDPAKTAAQASTALSNAVWTNTLAGYLDAAISSRSSHSAADVKTAVEAAGSHLALILEDTGTTIPAALSAMSAEAVVAELLATEIDGVTVESLWEAQLSDLLGKVTVSGSGGTRTFTYYKQDGTTVKMTITATVPTGARTTTGQIDPE